MKSPKIIKINGFRGIILAVFVCTCLFAGFVVFPGYVAMNIWNHFASASFPTRPVPPAMTTFIENPLLLKLFPLLYFSET